MGSHTHSHRDASQEPTINTDWEVSPRQTQAALEAGEDWTLIDCRTPGEYAIANIDGAHFMPMQTLPDQLETLEAYTDRRLVIYCHHGMRSLQVAAFLRQQGFGDVMSMAGGIDLWSQTIDPSIDRY